MNRGHLLTALIAAPVAVVLLLFGFLVLLVPDRADAAACGTLAGGAVDLRGVPKGPVAGYSGVQLTNAAHIMNAASALGLSRQAQILGVMTAMGESGLRVLDYGDAVGPDSRGLFQQRANGAWGSLADRMDPTTSATNFYKALQRVSGWQTLEPTIAIHRVQVNADPYHYARYQAAAATVVNALAGAVTASTTTPAASAATAAAASTDSATAATTDSACSSGALAMPLKQPFNMTDDYGPRVSPIAGLDLTWHAGDDLQNYPGPCGQPIYAILPGTVTTASGYVISIRNPAGYSVLYLHEYPSGMHVRVGDTVKAGQQIGVVGDNGPATGCHLHLAVNVAGSTDARINTLPRSQTLGAPAAKHDFVDPEKFFALFGERLCDSTCRRAS